MAINALCVRMNNIYICHENVLTQLNAMNRFAVPRSHEVVSIDTFTALMSLLPPYGTAPGCTDWPSTDWPEYEHLSFGPFSSLWCNVDRLEGVDVRFLRLPAEHTSIVAAQYTPRVPRSDGADSDASDDDTSAHASGTIYPRASIAVNALVLRCENM